MIAHAPQAAASEGVVLGDSIGFGIAAATGLKGMARVSLSLRRPNLEADLAKVARDAVVVLSLGTNDAEDPVAQLSKFIEKVIDVASASNRRIVWLGPPCMLNRHGEGARVLDEHLKSRLATTTIQYVSLRDDWICRAENRTRDGVHFHHSGYLYVWEKVRRESSYAADVSMAQCTTPPKPAGGKGARVAGQICTAGR